MCTNIPAGMTDPNSGCVVDNNPAGCGNDGTCDGAGACRKWGKALTKQCAAATCPMDANTGTELAVCDGISATCPAGKAVSCGTFKCDAMTRMCKTMCTVPTQSADCVSGKVCEGGSCGKNAVGTSCTQTSDCAASLFCVDRTCCKTDKCGTCQTCGNAAGTCASVKAGDPDPDSCSDETSTNTCGLTGVCDGGGACKAADSTKACGFVCNPARTASVSYACDGAGMCASSGAGAVNMCNNYKCVMATGLCGTRCQMSDDCLAPKNCVQGACVDP
jgi:hypothetical protein